MARPSLRRVGLGFIPIYRDSCTVRYASGTPPLSLAHTATQAPPHHSPTPLSKLLHHFSLPTAHCPLLTPHFFIFLHCQLSTANCKLLTNHFSMGFTHGYWYASPQGLFLIPPSLTRSDTNCFITQFSYSCEFVKFVVEFLLLFYPKRPTS
jgi:hypothetical protein